MRKWLEKVCLDVNRPKWVSNFLWCCSLVYRFGVFLRNFAYDRGVACAWMPPVPAIISIGNYVAGGTGKTPLTILLAQTLAEKYPTAILSRGYRSAVEHNCEPVQLSSGAGPQYPASFCGDEAYLISESVPRASFYVGKRRQASALQAVKDGAKILILEDGMQHRQLARDFEIVLIDGRDPFGSNEFLPFGLLREHPSGLKRANLIVINHAKDDTDYLSIKHQLSRFSDAPVVRVVAHLDSIELDGEKVGLFCGIAKPNIFKEMVTAHGATIVDELITADHVISDVSSLNQFAEKAAEKGATSLVCTEKDRVKLDAGTHLALPVRSIKMYLEIVDGHEHWDNLLESIQGKIS